MFCRLCGKDSFVNSAPGSRGGYIPVPVIQLQHPWAGAAWIKVTDCLGISSLQEMQATFLGLFPGVLPAGLWLVRALSNSLQVFVVCSAVGVPRYVSISAQHPRLQVMALSNPGGPPFLNQSEQTG